MSTTRLSLLVLVKRNDPQGWTRFVELYFPMLSRWAQSVGIEENESEDVAQRVLQIAMQQMPSFVYDPKRRGFRAWLKTIATRQALSLKRGRKAALADFSAAEPEDPSHEDELNRKFDEQHAMHLVYHEIAPLKSEFSDQAWTAFWDTTYHGLSAKEVADKLKITEAHVFVLKSRVLKRLRHLLADLLA